jgi:hypothetical protein
MESHRSGASKMTSENTSDSTKIAVSLAHIEEQMKSIAESVSEIKKNITLGEGSTLRDSVQREIGKANREQHKACGIEMKLVADSSVSIAVNEHLEKYHKKTSIAAQKANGFNWATLQPVALFLVKRVLPLILAGGLGIGGMKAMETPQEGPVKVSTQKGE